MKVPPLKVILLIAALALPAAVSIGPAPQTMSNMIPQSFFWRAPYIASFEIVRDGAVLHREQVPGQNQGAVLQATLGRPAYETPSSARRPGVQTGDIKVTVPISFLAQGSRVGISHMGKPIEADQIEVLVAIRRYGLIPRDYTDGCLDQLILAAAMEGVRIRVADGHPQSAIKQKYGITPR